MVASTDATQPEQVRERRWRLANDYGLVGHGLPLPTSSTECVTSPQVHGALRVKLASLSEPVMGRGRLPLCLGILDAVHGSDNTANPTFP